jgi:hypothetical protein
MKKILLITVVLILSKGFTALYSQAPCKVLKPQIAGAYSGECKNGLAEGKGESTGEDFYKGEFVKGLPDGVGTYTWKNGATYSGQWKKGMRDGNGIFTQKLSCKDSTLVGKWENDKYLGNPNNPAYVIEYTNSIGRVTVIRAGDRPYVQYKFSRGGGGTNEISNLLLQGSSGTENNQTPFTGFEQVTFPFKGKVAFNVPNSFRTGLLSCELRFTIFEPGAWIVNISF